MNLYINLFLCTRIGAFSGQSCLLESSSGRFMASLDSDEEGFIIKPSSSQDSSSTPKNKMIYSPISTPTHTLAYIPVLPSTLDHTVACSHSDANCRSTSIGPLFYEIFQKLCLYGLLLTLITVTFVIIINHAKLHPLSDPSRGTALEVKKGGLEGSGERLIGSNRLLLGVKDENIGNWEKTNDQLPMATLLHSLVPSNSKELKQEKSINVHTGRSLLRFKMSQITEILSTIGDRFEYSMFVCHSTLLRKRSQLRLLLTNLKLSFPKLSQIKEFFFILRKRFLKRMLICNTFLLKKSSQLKSLLK